MKAKLVKESLNEMAYYKGTVKDNVTANPEDIKWIEDNIGFGQGQYGNYYIKAFKQLAAQGKSPMSIKQVSDKVYDALENYWTNPPMGVNDEYEMENGLVKRAGQILSQIPIVRDWANIMHNLSDGELSYNDHHPGYFDGIDRFLEVHKDEFEDSDFGERFIDTSSYLKSTPSTSDHAYKKDRNIHNIKSMFTDE